MVRLTTFGGCAIRELLRTALDWSAGGEYLSMGAALSHPHRPLSRGGWNTEGGPMNKCITTCVRGEHEYVCAYRGKHEAPDNINVLPESLEITNMQQL